MAGTAGTATSGAPPGGSSGAGLFSAVMSGRPTIGLMFHNRVRPRADQRLSAIVISDGEDRLLGRPLMDLDDLRAVFRVSDRSSVDAQAVSDVCMHCYLQQPFSVSRSDGSRNRCEPAARIVDAIDLTGALAAVHTAGRVFPAFVTQLDQTAGGVGDRPQLHLAGGYSSARTGADAA